MCVTFSHSVFFLLIRSFFAGIVYYDILNAKLYFLVSKDGFGNVWFDPVEVRLILYICDHYYCNVLCAFFLT